MFSSKMQISGPINREVDSRSEQFRGICIYINTGDIVWGWDSSHWETLPHTLSPEAPVTAARLTSSRRRIQLYSLSFLLQTLGSLVKAMGFGEGVSAALEPRGDHHRLNDLFKNNLKSSSLSYLICRMVCTTHASLGYWVVQDPD